MKYHSWHSTHCKQKKKYNCTLTSLELINLRTISKRQFLNHIWRMTFSHTKTIISHHSKWWPVIHMIRSAQKKLFFVVKARRWWLKTFCTLWLCHPNSSHNVRLLFFINIFFFFFYFSSSLSFFLLRTLSKCIRLKTVFVFQNFRHFQRNIWHFDGCRPLWHSQWLLSYLAGIRTSAQDIHQRIWCAIVAGLSFA